MIAVMSVIAYVVIVFCVSYFFAPKLFAELNEGKSFWKTVFKYSALIIVGYSIAVLILWFGY